SASICGVMVAAGAASHNAAAAPIPAISDAIPIVLRDVTMVILPSVYANCVNALTRTASTRCRDNHNSLGVAAAMAPWARSVQLWQLVGEQIFPVIHRSKQIATGFFDAALQFCHVEAKDFATLFANAPANDHGIHVAAISRLDHGS